eukprot:1160934-Pelagomonas_calceolata.AAC.2
MDVPLLTKVLEGMFWRERSGGNVLEGTFWRELTRVTSLGSRWSSCGWRRVLPIPPAPPSTPQWITGIGPWHSFH